MTEQQQRDNEKSKNAKKIRELEQLVREKEEELASLKKAAHIFSNLFKANQGHYGSPRITSLLRCEGYVISERTVGKFMRELGLRSSGAKRLDELLED